MLGYKKWVHISELCHNFMTDPLHWYCLHSLPYSHTTLCNWGPTDTRQTTVVKLGISLPLLWEIFCMGRHTDATATRAILVAVPRTVVWNRLHLVVTHTITGKTKLLRSTITWLLSLLKILWMQGWKGADTWVIFNSLPQNVLQAPHSLNYHRKGNCKS